MSRKLTTPEFITKAEDIHGVGTYDYSKVVLVNTKTKVLIGCNTNLDHGFFSQTPSSHLHDNGCPKCGNLTSAAKRSLTTQDFTILANKEHGIGKYDYSKVVLVNTKTKVLIGCNAGLNHGFFSQEPKSHLKGNGCPKCGKLAIKATMSFSIEDFTILANKEHGIGKYDYSKVAYANSYTKVLIGCNAGLNHGFFSQAPRDHLTGHGCPKCTSSVSKLETEVLDSLSLKTLERQKRHLPGLPFSQWSYDGFCARNNTVYMVHGDYFHGNPKTLKADGSQKFPPNAINPTSQKTYGALYKETKRKELAIRKAGYNLHVIWESEWNNGEGGYWYPAL